MYYRKVVCIILYFLWFTEPWTKNHLEALIKLLPAVIKIINPRIENTREISVAVTISTGCQLYKTGNKVAIRETKSKVPAIVKLTPAVFSLVFNFSKSSKGWEQN